MVLYVKKFIAGKLGSRGREGKGREGK